MSEREVGTGAHTQDGPGLRVTCAAALARFRVRSPQWRRRRAAGWHSVRFPDPSLWWRRDQTPEDCGCSGQSLTGEARVVGVNKGRRGGPEPRPSAASPPLSAGNREPGAAAPSVRAWAAGRGPGAGRWERARPARERARRSAADGAALPSASAQPPR